MPLKENTKYALKPQFEGKKVPNVGPEKEVITLHSNLSDLDIQRLINKRLSHTYFEEIGEPKIPLEDLARKAQSNYARVNKKKRVKGKLKLPAIYAAKGSVPVAKKTQAMDPTIVSFALKGSSLKVAEVEAIKNSKNPEELAANENFATVLSVFNLPEDTTGEFLFKYLSIGVS